MAFAAGTGVLTFMDLVASVARKAIAQTKGSNINNTSGNIGTSASEKFSFVFYMSFLNE